MQKINRKFLFVIVSMLLVAMLSFTLVSCVDDTRKKEEKQYTAEEAYDKIIESFENKLNTTSVVGSFAIDTDISLNDVKYVVSLAGNIASKGESELVMSLKQDDKNIVSLYMIGDKVLLDINGTKINLKDLDLSHVLNKFFGADYDAVAGSVQPFVDIVFAMFVGDVTNVKVDNKEIINIELKIFDIITMALDIVFSSGVDGLMEMLDVKLPPNIDLEFLLSHLNVPEFSVMLTSISDNNVNKELNILVDAGSDALCNVNATLDFYATAQDIGIPDDVKMFESFSVTDFEFDVDLDLKTDKMDIGKIVNMIANKNVMPLGKLVFSSTLGYNMKVIADLDVEDNSKNLLFLELYAGDKTDKKIAGIYLKGDVLKIEIQDILPGYIGTPNLIVEGVNLSSQLKSIENAISQTINGFLDGLLPSKSENVIATVNYNEDNTKSIDPDLSTFFNIIFGTVGFEDNINLNEDKLEIKLNQKFFDILKQMVPTVEVKWPVADLVIDVNFGENCIDNINVALNDDELNADLNVNFRNLVVGYAPVALEKLIDDTTNGKIFATSVSELIIENLKGVSLDTDISMDIKAGTYDLATLLKVFGVVTPSIDMVFDESFKLDAQMKLQFTLDAENSQNTKLSFEIIAKNDFAFGSAGTLIGIYVKNNYLYVDFSGMSVSNVKLPKIGFEANITKIIVDAINKIDIGGLLSAQTSENKTTSSMSTSNCNDVSLRDLLYSEIILDRDALLFKATALSIQSLLSGFGIHLDLPDFDITAMISDGEIGVNISDDLSFNMDFIVNEFATGKDNIVVQLPDLNPSDYLSDVSDIIINKLSNFELNGQVTIDSEKGRIELQTLLNNILASSGLRLDFPINLDLKDNVTVFDINIAWKLNIANPDLSELKGEIFTNKNELLFGLYLTDGVVYADLTNLGLGGVKANNTGLAKFLVNTIVTEVDKINVDLKVLFDGLFSSPIADKANALEDTSYVSKVSYTQYLLDSVAMPDTKFTFKILADVLNKLLLASGIDLGVDASAEVKFDTENGTLWIGGKLDILTIAFAVSVNEKDASYEIVFNDQNFLNFADIDASNAEALIDTILDQIHLDLWIDLTVNNIDTGGGELDTRIAVELKQTAGVINFDAGNTLPYKKGDLLISVFEGHNVSSPIFYVKYDFESKELRVKFASDFLTIIVNLGHKIDLKFPNIDLKGMLVEAVGPLFKPTGGGSGGSGGSAGSAGGIFDGVNELINSINIAIHPNKKINVNADLVAGSVSKMLTDTLKNLFGPMNINYDAVNPGIFANELYENYIKAEIDKQVSGLGNADAIKKKVLNLVKRFLPVPIFTDVDLKLNVVDGKFVSVFFDAKDLVNDHFMKATIYNLAATDAVDWGTQESNVVISSGETDMTKWFKTSATIYTDVSDGGLIDRENIVWDYNTVLEKDKDGQYVAGEYVVTGTAFGRTVIVNVVIEGRTIERVEAIDGKVYESLPNSVNVIFTDGTSKMISGVDIIAPPTTYEKHSVEGVVLIDGESYAITVNYKDATIGKVLSDTSIPFDIYDYYAGEHPKGVFIEYVSGIKTSLDITWDFSNLSSLDITGGEFEVTAIIGEGVTAQSIPYYLTFANKEVKDVVINNVYNNLYINPYTTRGKMQPYYIANYYPTSVTVIDNNGILNVVDVTWDHAAVKYELAGGVYIAMIKNIVNGKLVWEKEIVVNVLNSLSADLTINADNTVIINPVDYFERKGSGCFPSTGTLMLGDGTVITNMPLAWDTNGFKVTYEGGVYYLNATIAAGTNLARIFTIRVVVDHVVAEKVVLENDTLVYNIYTTGTIYAENQLIKYSDGSIRSTVVKWDTSSVVIDITGGTYTAKVSFGETASAVTLDATVKVLDMTALSAIDVCFTYDEYIASSGEGFFADSIEIAFNSGIKMTLPVQWNVDNLLPTADGGNFVVYASFGEGAFAQTIAIKVIVSPIINTNGGTQL